MTLKNCAEHFSTFLLYLSQIVYIEIVVIKFGGKEIFEI